MAEISDPDNPSAPMRAPATTPRLRLGCTALVAVGFAAALAFVPPAHAQIYRSVDAQGHVKYSDTPSPGATLVHVDSLAGTHSSAASGGSSADSSLTALEKQSAQIHQQVQRQEAQRAVATDVAQARAKQCTQARANYQKLIQARRIYEKGKNGAREYLSDQAAEQMRVQAEMAMQKACQSSQ